MYSASFRVSRLLKCKRSPNLDSRQSHSPCFGYCRCYTYLVGYPRLEAAVTERHNMSKIVIYVRFGFTTSFGFVVYRPGDVIYSKDITEADFNALTDYVLATKFGAVSSAMISPPSYIDNAQAARLRGANESTIERNILLGVIGFVPLTEGIHNGKAYRHSSCWW